MNTNDIIEFKGKKIKYGRYLFNKCLPEDYPLIDEAVDGKKLNSIIDDIVLRYDSETVKECLDKIKAIGFNYSTYEGYTLSIEDLTIKNVEKYRKNLVDGDVEGNLKKISNKELLNKMKEKSFSLFIESGARGSWDQAKQLVYTRGHVADANNKIRKELIRSSLLQGLNEKEFFDSCWGSRKGLLDTALSTGAAGYLTRQLVYSAVNLELDVDTDNCGSKDFIKVDLQSIDKDSAQKCAKSLLWRYMKDQEDPRVLTLITTRNIDSLIGKIIEIRSPIYCKNKKICKVCYGNLFRASHSDQIGIIATQAIGERSTQLILRTFHLSGVANTDSIGSENDDIISGIGMTNKIFHKPSAIVDITSPEILIDKIYSIFSQYGNIHRVHYEVLISCMMWNGDKWWRLSENRNSIEPEYVSILQIPSRSSWLLGAAFSNMKKKILEGLIKERVDAGSSLTDLFKF